LDDVFGLFADRFMDFVTQIIFAVSIPEIQNGKEIYLIMYCVYSAVFDVILEEKVDIPDFSIRLTVAKKPVES
jgi:hypothetical protein